MNRFITMLLLATAVCTTTGSVSAQEADRILGIYKVEGETTHELSKVRIYKTGDTYEARIIWLEHPVSSINSIYPLVSDSRTL